LSESEKWSEAGALAGGLVGGYLGAKIGLKVKTKINSKNSKPNVEEPIEANTPKPKDIFENVIEESNLKKSKFDKKGNILREEYQYQGKKTINEYFSEIAKENNVEIETKPNGNEVISSSDGTTYTKYASSGGSDQPTIIKLSTDANGVKTEIKIRF